MGRQGKELRAVAEAIYSPAPDAKMLRNYGGEIADYLPEIYLHDAIYDAYALFVDLETQWDIAPAGGVTGLKYQSIAFVMDIHEVEDRKQAFRDIRVMEAAARTMINQGVQSG